VQDKEKPIAVRSANIVAARGLTASVAVSSAAVVVLTDL
jgi:hypothetical protein